MTFCEPSGKRSYRAAILEDIRSVVQVYYFFPELRHRVERGEV